MEFRVTSNWGLVAALSVSYWIEQLRQQKRTKGHGKDALSAYEKVLAGP